MAYPHNRRAPDDQVLDKLLVEGGWLARASFGWLPAAYLRTVPAYYQGVVPVIDHDHGNPPGLIAHSSSEPVLLVMVRVRVRVRARIRVRVRVRVTVRIPSPSPSPSPSPNPNPNQVLPPEIAADAVGGGGVVRMKCNAVSAAATAEWCEGSCTPWQCPEDLCKCEEDKQAGGR